MMRVAPVGVASMSITRQGMTRAKPCGQKVLSVGCAPNQGQHMGTPPRMERPLTKRALLDNHKTGSAKNLGCQSMTCAPCKAMRAVARGLSTSKYCMPASSWLCMTWACSFKRLVVLSGSVSLGWVAKVAVVMSGWLFNYFSICVTSRTAPRAALVVIAA